LWQILLFVHSSSIVNINDDTSTGTSHTILGMMVRAAITEAALGRRHVLNGFTDAIVRARAACGRRAPCFLPAYTSPVR
jgi:hypothetical protein